MGHGSRSSGHLTLFGSAISIKVCRGQMCRWFGSSKNVGSPPASFGGPGGILSSIYSWGMYSCWKSILREWACGQLESARPEEAHRRLGIVRGSIG